MKLDEFLDLLDGVKPSGSGYVARCPAHEDREASLGVYEGDQGIIINCYAGCDKQDVLAAIPHPTEDRTLQWSDLFYSSFNQAEPESVYSYVDETGTELFQCVRFPGKQFRQRHQGSDGEWVWNLDGVRRVLYRLPQVIEAVSHGRTVCIVEGEKDVHALEEAGQVATCNPMGAGKWRDDFAAFFSNANVAIIADRDAPGRKHAETVRESLQGVARGLWMVQARKGKDAADHLAAGHTLEEFVPIKKRVRRGLITAREMAEQAREDVELSEADLPAFVLANEVPVVFRQGRMYAIGAYQGHGKTCLALQGARKLASEGHRVTYFTLEMPERDLTNRLLSHRGIPLRMLENPWLLRQDPAMGAVFEKGVKEIEGWNLDVVFDSGITVKKMIEIVRDRESDVVFIDHIHRLSWGERRKFEEQIMQLTNLALELNIMLVVLCQLRKHTRGKDFEAYPRPTLQEFRETSQIGDDASMALAIWRQTDQGGISFTGQTQVIVLKNRHTTGPHDAQGMFWVPQFDPVRQMFVTGGNVEQVA